MSTIPLVDLKAQQAEIHEEVMKALDEILREAAFIAGPHVGAFEAAYAELVGVEHCIGLANGTDAVELALRACGIFAGDGVVVPANTFIATVEAVVRAGAHPVLVDVDPDHLLMDPKGVAAAVEAGARAVVPVHLFGQMAPVEQIAEAAPGLPLVEDAAQSHGASRHGQGAGSVGLAAATSFYPGKNLGAAGDAGAVTTRDPDVARRVRLLGAHGSERKYVHETLGFNSRLDTVQAAVLLAKLTRLRSWNAARQAAAARYGELLGGLAEVELPRVLPGNEHVWHLYVVRVPRREAVLARLHELGVGASIHYPQPVHLTQAFSHLGHQVGDFPVAERAAQEILSLPLFPHITEVQQQVVAEALATALKAT